MRCNRDTRQFHASCNALPKNVEALIVNFREFIGHHTAGQMAFDAELVVREALINAAEHGCCYSDKKTVSLDAVIDGKNILKLSIEHDGSGFNIDEKSGRPLPELAESGRGLFIIKSLSSSVQWSQEGRLLQVTLQLKSQEEKVIATETSTYAPREDLTAATVEQCRPKIMELVRATEGKFIMDLSNVHMVDSKGIGLIIALYNTLQTTSRELEIMGANSEIKSLFKLMRLDRHFVVS